MTNFEPLTQEVERLNALDAKRMQGEWYWSARTLRSEISEKDEDGDEFITERPDIISVDSDHCIYAREQDAAYITAMPDAIRTMNALYEMVVALQQNEESMKQTADAMVKKMTEQLSIINAFVELVPDPRIVTIEFNLSKKPPTEYDYRLHSWLHEAKKSLHAAGIGEG